MTAVLRRAYGVVTWPPTRVARSRQKLAFTPWRRGPQGNDAYRDAYAQALASGGMPGRGSTDSPVPDVEAQAADLTDARGAH
jgi:hypothetical protein